MDASLQNGSADCGHEGHTHTHTHTYAEKETNTQTVIGVANSGQALPRRERRRERKLHHGKSEILVVVSNDDPK